MFFYSRFLCGGKGRSLDSVKLNAERTARSWQLQTALIFLSPLRSQELPISKKPLLNLILSTTGLKNHQNFLFGDKANNSDSFDQRHYDNKGIMSIASHKYNLIQPQPQDVRVLRRYRRRWKVEQLFAWFHYIRRLIVRYEYHIENFLVMVLLGCIIILLKHF